jgi:DNA-binding response OmpR family regulator
MPKKVVIIDDEPDISKMVADFLIGAGYAAYYAFSGPDGLLIIEKEKPHLVLLDVGMPRMSGLEVLREIRKKDPLLPIVILSAQKDADTVKKALELGASEYITKPINLETLLNHFVKDLIGAPV